MDWKWGGGRGGTRGGWGVTKDGGQVGGGGGGLRYYGPRGRSGLQVPILVRGQPHAAAETSGKTIGWNRVAREERSTI